VVGRHRWRQRVVKSGLTCFDVFLALLDTWQDLIANYFIDCRRAEQQAEGVETPLLRVRNVGHLFQ
jgi:hypothetical protein